MPFLPVTVNPAGWLLGLLKGARGTEAAGPGGRPVSWGCLLNVNSCVETCPCAYCPEEERVSWQALLFLYVKESQFVNDNIRKDFWNGPCIHLKCANKSCFLKKKKVSGFRKKSES